MLLNLTENEFFLFTRSILWPRICRICVCGRGLASDATGGTQDALALLNPLVVQERTPLPNPYPAKEKGRNL